MVLAGLLAVVALAIFLAAMVAVLDGSAAPTDRHVELGIHHDVTSAFRAPMLLVTTLGGPVSMTILSVVAGVYFFLRRTYWAAALMVVAPAGAGLLERIIKIFVHRHRPHLWHNALIDHTYSFPSGHATAVMAVFGALTFILWQRHGPVAGLVMGGVSALIVLMVGFSRVYLGVHWPADIVGGYSLALFWLSLLILAISASGRRIHPRVF